MLNVKKDGERFIIDVRERILAGEHPRFAIMDYVKESPVGTIIDIHTPRKPVPLIKGLEEMGVTIHTNEVAQGHFYLEVTKN